VNGKIEKNVYIPPVPAIASIEVLIKNYTVPPSLWECKFPPRKMHIFHTYQGEGIIFYKTIKLVRAGYDTSLMHPEWWAF